MKNGKSLYDLAKELDRQIKSKRDFLAPTGELKVIPHLNDIDLQVGNQGAYKMLETCHDQVASRLSIPQKYYDRMRSEARSLLIDNVNYWLRAGESEMRMIRTLDGNARAFLSGRYRPLDNFDLAEAVLPKLMDLDCRIESCELTEKRMYIKAVCPKIEGQVAVGDICQAGVIVSNSEIGCGSLRVEPLVFRLICRNGMISADYSMRKYHVGKNSDEQENASEFFRDETRKADDKAFWMKVEDLVSGTLSKTGFEKIIANYKIAKSIKLEGDPVKTVEVLAEKKGLSDDERGGVLKYLVEGGELSLYGLMNSVTRFSQDVENYDRATELERLGGEIISASGAEVRELVLAK